MTDETKTPPEPTTPPTGSEPSKPGWWDEEPKWMGEMREMLNPDPAKEDERRARNRQQLDASQNVHNADNDDADGDPFEIVSVEELPELIEDATEPVKAAAGAVKEAVEKAPEKVHALFRQWGGRKG